jgi:serine/threonine-protein kinase
MTPERWKQVEELFHTVAARPKAERSAFLDRACAGDEALREEVERLFASHDEPGIFMKAPALEAAAMGLAHEQAGLMIGNTIGHYKILSLLGAGGMGEVYLAQDTTLGRRVALKLLRGYSTTDGVQRFQQEARAASALSHPNIAHIYEIGEAAGTNFIAMEYIEGQSLAQRISGRPLATAQILDLGMQVADALDEAHSKGITHRDIKSANVMVTARSVVKVLDFGLAKLAGPAAEQTPDNEAATQVKTRPGVVMGTVSNMSPEQALGRNLDHRSDIFSLGVVLYEMATGRLPFSGESVTETIDKIAHAQPAAIARLNYDVPAELENIIKKALRKNRDERYQTARDLEVDLRSLKEDLQFEEKRQRSTSPEAGGPTGSGSAGHENLKSAAEPAIRTAEIGATRPTSSAEYVVSGIKHHKVIALVALVILIAGVASLAAYFHARNTEVAIESIAVLPFSNQSHDPDSEYLSDGISESIINSLSQLSNLRVLARSTVFRYKGRETDPLAVGRELGVRAVLAGRVIQRGDNLTVSVELVDVRDNKQLWGEQYQRKVSDLLAVERDIAQEITGNLRLKLSGPEQSRVARHYTVNPEAYPLYLKGRYFWNKFTPADHQRAAEYFNQAIAKDPTFALAYVGLADTYGASATNSWINPLEGYAKAKAAVKKALEIDDTLAEAHATLGALTMFYDMDWTVAEREYKRAFELNSNYILNYEVYSYLLSATGRPNEAIDMAKRGLVVDPLSVVLSNDTGQAYYLARRYDEAVTQYQKSIEIDPSDPSAYIALGGIYEQQGMYDQAIAAYQKAIKGSERTSIILGSLGHAYAASGRSGEALKILDELKEMAKQKYVSAYDLAILYTGLGDKDHAIEQLNKAYEERAGWIINLRVEPLFDPLRSDPRFPDLLRRVGL